MPEERKLTLGESRVRLSFNPSANSTVDMLKQMAAAYIDACEELRGPTRHADPEVQRCISLAQTHIEDAAMWAVKAATFGK